MLFNLKDILSGFMVSTNLEKPDVFRFCFCFLLLVWKAIGGTKQVIRLPAGSCAY